MKSTKPETIPAGENCVQMLCMTLQVLQQSQSRKPKRNCGYDKKKMLMQMSASESVPDNEEDNEEAVPENKLTLDNLAKGFNCSRVL